jgi:hypothetical protein
MGESQVIAAGAALSAFSGASQHNRLMRLDFPFEERRAGRFHRQPLRASRTQQCPDQLMNNYDD